MDLNELLSHQIFNYVEINNLKKIYNKERKDLFLVIKKAFLYGVIQGKREERVKNKRKHIKSM